MRGKVALRSNLPKLAFGHLHIFFTEKYFRFLRALACFDALFLFSAILAFGLPTLSTTFVETLFHQIMGPLFGLLHIFRTGVVYCTLAVTYERFHSVVKPLVVFRHKKYLITFIVVFSTLYNIPKFFEVTSQVHSFLIKNARGF